MNEIIDEKEKKKIKSEEIINFFIFQISKNLRLHTYNIFNLITNKNYKINNEEKIYQSEANINNENKIINIFNIIVRILESLKYYLSIFNNNQYYILPYDYSRFSFKLNCNKNFTRIDLCNIIYINLINVSNNMLMRNIIKSERNIRENNLIKNRVFKTYNDNSKSINDYINEYIENMIKDLQKNSKLKLKGNKEIKYPKIFFNCEISNLNKNIPNSAYCKQFVEIYIKFFIFDIYIKIPYYKIFNIYNFFYKVLISIKSKYNEYNENSLTNTKKEFNLDIKNNFQNLVLIKKLKTIFEARIYRIIKLIIDEKKYNKKIPIGQKITIEERNDFFGKDVLIEFCKRFISYIYDYNNLFNTKCAVCDKIAKYSLTEKCFFPPYYKIYKEVSNLRYNIEENPFFHEECFKKISLKNL